MLIAEGCVFRVQCGAIGQRVNDGTVLSDDVILVCDEVVECLDERALTVSSSTWSVEQTSPFPYL